MPRASVIIPTHNRSHLLTGAIESAQRAGSDVEIIVVDDASTDDTAAVCRTLDGIRYIHLERNQGVAAARNVGIIASTAPYIAFLDDDDRRLPGSLDLQSEALAADPEAAFVCGSVLYADQNGELTGTMASPPEGLGEDVFWKLLEWDFFILPVAALIRKACLYRVGLPHSHLSHIEDWDIFVRLAELFPVVVMNHPAGIYRLPTPFSEQTSSNQAPDFLRAVRRQQQLFLLPRVAAAPVGRRKGARRRTLNRFADILFCQAAMRLPEGAYRFAGENFLTGLRLSPRRAVRPYIYQQLWRSLQARRTGGRMASV